ncbi:MAG: YjjG family noncanonical pyrimidine nucleotidase [Bacteroidota bacterium]
MSGYRHIFFDLDHTLWDFDTNSAAVLADIYGRFSLKALGTPGVDAFIATYREVNDQQWAAYREGKISKAYLRTARYVITLAAFGVDRPDLADEIGTYYLSESPRRTHLIAHAVETLDHLQKKYTLHILTNGFEEVQHVKLRKSGLRPYFQTVVTSEQVGVRKPDPAIFQHALKQSGGKASETLMIGDDLNADVLGAMQAGWGGVYFNPGGTEHNKTVTREVKSLRELQDWL